MKYRDLRVNYTTDWVWFRWNTRDGPSEGTELVQHGDDPVPVELSDGITPCILRIAKTAHT